MVAELAGGIYVCERYLCGRQFVDSEDAANTHEKSIIEHVAAIRDEETGRFKVGTLEKDGFKTLVEALVDETTAMEAAEKYRDIIKKIVADTQNNG